LTFKASTKLGRILRDPAATEIMFAGLPAIAGSPHLALMRSFTLEDVAGMLGTDDEVFARMIRSLGELPDDRRSDPEPLPCEQYEPLDVKVASATVVVPETCALWGIHEVVLDGPAHGNPFVDVELGARYVHGDRSVDAWGFYDGDGTYRVRFMPDAEGPWTFRTYSNARSLDTIEGTFVCGEAEPGTHGPVHVAQTFHFGHADGTPHLPIGTTCYAWTHQDDDLQQQTLATLATSPFNKLRMCVFPKSYLFNENEPQRHAFECNDDGAFDLTRFNPAFFRHLERRVADLARLGIQADVILFHPYDRWGYSEMPPTVDDRYLRYVVARLAAFDNVWWSLANEYDFMWDKETADWERFGQLVATRDPHDHLIGIHNGREIFDHSRPWISHCSMQRVDSYRTAENTTEWREQWNKPVVIDECAYEGDIEFTWGNVTAQELTRRCWEGALRGGYVGHGETYVHPSEVLWWSKGGVLRGESPARIAFLRAVLEAGPLALEPLATMSRWGYPTAGVEGQYYLQYLGFFQPRSQTFELPEQERYRYEVIDTWEMTITDHGAHAGPHRVDLPAKPHLAIRITRLD